MKIHSDIHHLPVFRNAVVTIGTFDGVHVGHRQIIKQLIEKAGSINGETVVITFHPHPRKIVGSDLSNLYLINTTEEKTDLLKNLSIDHLVIVPFTEAFASQSATGYVEDFLIRKFHPHTLIIGYDHHFGKGREGNYKLLEDYAARQGFNLIEIAQHLLHQSAISSTRIRENLLKGDIEDANELLGYSYFFKGTVIEGNKLGRSLGFPTANLEIKDKEKLIPGNGVYAVELEILKNREIGSPNRLKGMMNIGVRPTIDGKKKVIEIHIFDFNEDIYGLELQVHLRYFLRKEQKFNGLDALKEQLSIDRSETIRLLSSGNALL
ncbi:MAG: bifunctional riboflavin kinase/FAD synthetase [Chitinophagaceae bacterium]